MDKIAAQTQRWLGLGICLLATAGVACSQSSQTQSCCSQQSEARKAIERALKQARAEVATITDHEWAGEYFYGNGTSCNVTVVLTPDQNVIYTWHGCLGLYDSNRGRITEVLPDRIRIEWEKDPAKSEWGTISKELIRVRWGSRHYLVPDTRLIEFCIDANCGSEPGLRFCEGYDRPHSFLLRRSEWQELVKGQPDVPAAYAKYLLKQPVTVKITRVISKQSAPNRRDTFEVEINAGEGAGLFPGMTLAGYEEGAPRWASEIVSVGPDVSRVEITNYDSGEDSEPQVGDKLSSRHWLFRADNPGSVAEE